MAIDKSCQFSHNVYPLNTKEQIRQAYGDDLCQQVGINKLMKMPRVTAESVNLIGGKYLPTTVTVESLQGHEAVKGIDTEMRPFVAYKIQQFDTDTQTAVAMVEVLYRSSSLGGAFSFGHYFLSSLNNLI
jgi:hypothetical protein